MKLSPRPPRTASKLSDSVQHTLNMYAFAASAAGVAMLAAAHPAEAKVVYTRAHFVLSGDSGLYQLDLNHDGVTDFSMANWFSCEDSECSNSLYIHSPAGNGVEARSEQYYHRADALKEGDQIGGKSQSFYGRWVFLLRSWVGQWYNVKDRYLGVRFLIKDAVHYGWVRASTKGKGFTFSATVTGYAYETIPNKPIIAGKTKGPDVITVEPGSLGELALGRK